MSFSQILEEDEHAQTFGSRLKPEIPAGAKHEKPQSVRSHHARCASASVRAATPSRHSQQNHQPPADAARADAR